MDKSKLIQTLEEHLRDELQSVTSSGDTEAAKALERQLLVYRFLPRRTYSSEDVIIPSALVELDLAGSRAYYFLVPQGGGLITRVDGKPVQVVTPQSPIGEAILGKKAGETVSVEIRGAVREYRIISVS